MKLRQIYQAIRRWGWLGAIPVVIVSLHVLLTYQSPPTSYQVVMRFTAGGEPATPLSGDYDRYYAWLASEYIANGLADLAMTGSFAEAVAERLAAEQMIVPPQAIQTAIVTDNAQSVMVVYVTWPDPDQAVLIAEAISEELVQQGPLLYPQMDEVGQVARQVDTPVAHRLPQSLRAQLLQPAIRLLVATIGGAALILLAYWLDPWVRSVPEVEESGIHVVGTVPQTKR